MSNGEPVALWQKGEAARGRGQIERRRLARGRPRPRNSAHAAGERAIGAQRHRVDPLPLSSAMRLILARQFFVTMGRIIAAGDEAAAVAGGAQQGAVAMRENARLRAFGQSPGSAECTLLSEIACSTPIDGNLPGGLRSFRCSPKAFDLLVYLVQNREHVVSKDDLLHAVWEGRIVSEFTLTSHINAVRRAIGDSGEAQRLVRTLARKGFRFVGDVRELQSSDDKSGFVKPNETSAEALVLPDKPSIAVLPFLNLSGDPEQEYFADGVVEDVISALSRIRWLFVIARNSSFTYKGRAVDVKHVGRELGVRYVLEGSLRKAANRVRITGQLIDATTAAHLWADRFEGTLDDIFELQDQMTANVVGAIAPQLERAEIERAKRKPTESLYAYDYYLRGRTKLNQGTREAVGEGLPLFYKAIELDPDFASAYAMAAWCHVWRKVNGWMIRSPEGGRRGHPPRAPGDRTGQGRRCRLDQRWACARAFRR